jgi:hypothetical protein
MKAGAGLSRPVRQEIKSQADFPHVRFRGTPDSTTAQVSFALLRMVFKKKSKQHNAWAPKNYDFTTQVLYSMVLLYCCGTSFLWFKSLYYHIISVELINTTMEAIRT